MTQHHHLHLHQHNNKSNNNNKGRQRPNLITMDIDNNKTRDSRRPLPFTANAFPKRRHSTIPFRRSSQEGEVELVQETETETVRLKGKRERDREREPSKRRRGSYEEAESVANEHQDGDVFDAGVSRELSSNTASSSAPDSNHRRTFSSTPLPLLPLRPPSISREIIGVTVPRKARSAGAKRTHASPAFGTSEEQSSRSAVAASSPSFSSVSLKKMKLIGSKTRLSEELKLCSSTDEDIDIEIAELLFDLKTSNSSYYSSSQKLEPSTSPSTLPSDDADNKKVEDYSSSALAAQFVKVEKLSDDADNGPCHEIGSSEAVKLENDLNSGAGYDIFPDGRSEFFTSETPSKLDVNKHEDFASIRDVPAISEDKGQRVDKFEIDLMAPPPMMTSPERDNLLMCEDSVKLKDNAERLAKKEKMKEEDKDVAMDELKLDLKPSKHIEEQVRNMEQPIKFTNLKVEKTGESSSVSLSTAVSEGPGNLLAVSRYMAPMQNVVKTEKTTVSAMAPQEHMSFVLSEPRAKRCATHHYIARNVFFHQQRTKMNPLLPSAVASGPPPCNTKYNDINCMRSAGSMLVGKKSQKHSSLNQSVAQEKGCAATNDYSLASVRNSALANSIDSTQMKQLVLQQGSQPGSTGNLVHGPAFLFPTGQHQASKTTTAIQAAGVNSTSSAALSNKSHSSPVGALGTSSTLAGVAAATGFSSPNLTANDTPYMTIVPNSGYPFPFSTPLGASAAIKGASPAQPTPILNGPLYTSQMFHPLQHPHSQSLIQPSYLNASNSNGSSSHKQSQGTQINDNSVLTTPMQLQLLQKQHALLSNPHKHDEIGMAGENSPSIGGTSYSQKNVFGQNFTIPVQPVNFSFRPSGTSDNIVGGNGGNFSDKKQLPQAPKGGDDRMPSQPFAISFAAFNGSAVPSNLNFSSLAQNPMIFQNLPDIASWQGYQAASASHTMQQNIYSVTEGKYGGKSSHQDDEKKASTSGKSSTNVPTTLVFDNSSKNLNFVPPPMNVNWPSHSMTSTSTTSSSPLSSIASNSHQHPLQLFHLQQQHGMLQQLPAMPTQYKASSTNSTIATKHVNSPTVFSQTLNQCKISNQASQSKNTSIVTSATPSLNGFSYEQERVLQGHSQISFVGSYMPALPPQQGQQLLSNTQPFGTNSIVAGTPPNGGGNMKTNSQGSKPVPSLSINTSQKHQTENSSAGSSQKSSPVCGRNVPSILSSFPSHLSELKY
ncbi:protein TIME FOR COFFEE isoform X1 [Arachis hypogaea]|uniref:protein TIME FOR COFFEE isoform X1 n=2 Tax=Arachis TaxID=3817 RepID=UPI000DEC88FD|nr:protein TIME FOR COFFEE isoform X1 [Arachis hypogaea]QHN84236.1 Protein TIME FOR COFFEE [Arachis hypogaea]